MQRDPGPHPAVRAILGLGLGLALGAVVALLLPRARQAAVPPDDTATAAQQP